GQPLTLPPHILLDSAIKPLLIKDLNMYSNENIEQRRVRSVVSSVGGRTTQRRSGAINTNSRLFMTAVKDASRSARSEPNGERPDEYLSKAQLAKRPYSPTSDFRIDDDRFQNKTRKIENDSAAEQFRSFENNDYNMQTENNPRNYRHSSERMHDRASPSRNSGGNHINRYTPERQISRQTPDRVNVRMSPDLPSPDLMYDTPPRSERGRFGRLYLSRNKNVFTYFTSPQFSFEPSRPLAQPRSVLDRLGKKGGMTTAYINPAFFHNPPAPIPDIDMMSPQNTTDSIVLGPKVSRCRHWPNCDLGPACKFHHPTEICRQFPNCPNSDRTCLYIHPATDVFDSYPRNPFGANSITQTSRQQTNMRRNIAPTQSAGFISSEKGTNVLNENSAKQNGTTNGEQSTMEKSVTETISKFGEACAKPICMFAHASPASVGTGTAPPALIETPCKYDTECTNPKCKFAHSSPAAAIATQEPCRYYPNCQNQNCPYLHTDFGDESKVPTPCWKGATCTRPDCYFLHPWDMDTSNMICKFGVLCRRPDCKFQHPNGKSKSEFGSVISEHSFTVDEDDVEDAAEETGAVDNKENASETKETETTKEEKHDKADNEASTQNELGKKAETGEKRTENRQVAQNGEAEKKVETEKNGRRDDEFLWEDLSDIIINDSDHIVDIPDYMVDL
ncbi:1747_t:CDS:10, partial [Ambispora gerdemannii]